MQASDNQLSINAKLTVMGLKENKYFHWVFALPCNSLNQKVYWLYSTPFSIRLPRLAVITAGST